MTYYDSLVARTRKVEEILEEWEDNDEQRYWLFFETMLLAKEDGQESESAKQRMAELGIPFESWIDYEDAAEGLAWFDC